MQVIGVAADTASRMAPGREITSVSVELTTPTPAGRADHAAASQRQAARTGPADACAAEEIMELLPQLPVWQDWDARRRAQARRGAAAILRWLAAFPGAGWQQRWQAADADAGLDWLHAVPLGGQQPASPVSQRETSRNGLAGLLLCRAVLPGYQLLAGYQAQTLFADARRVIQPDVFAKITGHAAAAGMPSHLVHAGLTVITKLMLHTGQDVTKLSFGHFIPHLGAATIRLQPSGHPARLGPAARHRRRPLDPLLPGHAGPGPAAPDRRASRPLPDPLRAGPRRPDPLPRRTPPRHGLQELPQPDRDARRTVLG